MLKRLFPVSIWLTIEDCVYSITECGDKRAQDPYGLNTVKAQEKLQLNQEAGIIKRYIETPPRCIKHQAVLSSTDLRSIGGHGADPMYLPLFSHGAHRQRQTMVPAISAHRLAINS